MFTARYGLKQDVLYGDKRTKEAVTTLLTWFCPPSVRPSVFLHSSVSFHSDIFNPPYSTYQSTRKADTWPVPERQIVPIMNKNTNFNGLLLKGSIHFRWILVLHANCKLARIHWLTATLTNQITNPHNTTCWPDKNSIYQPWLKCWNKHSLTPQYRTVLVQSELYYHVLFKVQFNIILQPMH